MARLACVATVAVLAGPNSASADSFVTHAPMHPLPAASARPVGTGPAHYVDGKRGDDAGDGTTAHPWKTVQFATAHARPGDTIYLHGGVYFENVVIQTSGTENQPITLRSAAGELAVIDGGLREFVESPQQAWRRVADTANEFESTSTYPALGASGDEDARGQWVTGNFVDSMIPLHGYKYDADFHSTDQYWTVKNTTPGTGVYVGPGVWFDPTTHRIHIRLDHTTLASQGKANYTGETDPRKLQIVVGVDHSALAIAGAKHVKIQDVVVRGSSIATVAIDGADDIALDGVTIYGGSPALWVKSTSRFLLLRSVLRGLASPWSSRASMKYRSNAPYLMVAGNKAPQSKDWDLGYDEFTDSHDGIVLDSIKKLRLHNSRIDNFNDDGIYLALPPRDSVPDDVQIFENYVTRVYTTFAYAQHRTESNAVGSGVFIYRNVFDLRDGTYAWIAKDAAADTNPTGGWLAGRMCGDHGSPTWEPMYVYNNTIITAGPTFRDYYGAMLGTSGTKGTTRRVFDNLFVQLSGDPGLGFANVTDDVQVDGNLMWGTHSTRPVEGFFDKFRASKAFEASKKVYPPGFGAHDVHADPRLSELGENGKALDVHLKSGSPAIDAGVAIPAGWPDSMRTLDKGQPDIGALPSGAAMFAVGPSAAP